MFNIQPGGAISLYDPTFANNDWSKIIQACQRNAVPDTWAVGNSKPMTINGTEYNIDIIGKNHDTYSDGSGTAPLTFQLHEAYATASSMATSKPSPFGWKYTKMYSTTLPNFLSLLPQEVQDAVKAVNKRSTLSYASQYNSTTKEKIFILSATELLGDTSTEWSTNQGTQYEYYSSGGSKGKNTPDGSQAPCWTRSISLVSDGYFIVRTYTSQSTASYNSNKYYAPAFCF